MHCYEYFTVELIEDTPSVIRSMTSSWCNNLLIIYIMQLQCLNYVIFIDSILFDELVFFSIENIIFLYFHLFIYAQVLSWCLE